MIKKVLLTIVCILTAVNVLAEREITKNISIGLGNTIEIKPLEDAWPLGGGYSTSDYFRFEDSDYIYHKAYNNDLGGVSGGVYYPNKFHTFKVAGKKPGVSKLYYHFIWHT